ncbi:MAG: NUDIX domain-containing protein [Candidatus Diapherotrites archaeon]|nr:NUDIX domain-containing protein [Candidatus Diapherotrites archaeon]
MRNEISAGCVLFVRENANLQFLLLHYSKGHWDFPKGHIEGNESAEEAMLRELKEETGIASIKVIPGFEERITYFFKQNGETIKKEVIFFLVESATKEVKLSFEHIGYEWLPYKEAVKKVTFNNAKQVLKKAYEFLKQRSLGDFIG